MSRFRNLLNKRFGKLLVISRDNNVKNYRTRWICKCGCGKNKSISSSQLLRKKYPTSSCGCSFTRLRSDHPSWKGCGKISSIFFKRIISSADLRDIECNITIDYIWNLFLSQNENCKLTGLPLSFETYSHSSDGTASLDRIDSMKGYIKGNVQWVHKDINMMKQNFTEQKLLDYCQLIINHRKVTQVADEGCLLNNCTG